MNTAAIICEYNPFHNGHLYQINRIKEELKADRIIMLMSGDFVQRGEPSIYNKEVRSEWAIKNGGDLLLMLPTFASTGSSDLFAYTAVSILNKLGAVDYLCFGAECSSLETLININKEINSEDLLKSPEFLKLLSDGNTFAKARSLLFPQYIEELSKPNNILAIDYLNSLRLTHSSIKPYLIKRTNDDYKECDLPKEGNFASATSIRNSIINKNIDNLEKYMPSDMFQKLSELIPVTIDDFSKEIYYKLLSDESLDEYLDVSGDLRDRIKNLISEYSSFSEFAEKLKTKNLTRTRINRALIHILLNIKHNNDYYKEHINDLYHVRVLGMKRSSGDLFKTIQVFGKISLMTNVSDYLREFNDFEKEIFNTDYLASTLYDSVNKGLPESKTTPEYSKQPFFA